MATKPQPQSPDGISRCWWCLSDPLYIKYHDEEWGIPVRDDHKLFEMLILETFQAGLSWITILKKRENFRAAFDNFIPEKVARYTDKKKLKLMENAGIVRSLPKIEAAINNAKIFLDIQKVDGSFSDFMWSFTGNKTLRHAKKMTKELIPATTPESDAMAKALKKRGFKFIGATTCYAHMQAAGMFDDHVGTCFRAR